LFLALLRNFNSLLHAGTFLFGGRHNFYLITTFVVLLTGAEAADKATSGTQHLLDQGATTSRED
jgi:hypothetical protein